MLGTMLRRVLAAALMAALFGPVAAQAEDTTCRNGLFADGEGFRQAQVRMPGRTFFHEDTDGCPVRPANGAGCRTNSYVIEGDALVIDGRRIGNYVCAFYPNDQGGTAGWIEVTALHMRPTDTSPPAAAWEGGWSDGGSADLLIEPRGERPSITGTAFWPARPEENDWPTIHIGEVDGTLAIAGNRATYADDNLCELELTLLADFLLVADNRRCGGVNVTFSGVYTRAR